MAQPAITDGTASEPDGEPWDRIVARHTRAVWLTVVSLGVPADKARDVVQATWARLYEQRRSFERSRGTTEVKMPGLAIAQARFLAIDALRRSRVERRHLATVVADDVDHIDPERQVMSRERLARAADALAKCTAQEQRIFRTVYDDPARPHADIAADVGLSVQRVRQILCEVRAKLREAMES
jgi:RNA polymerase sigma-70 factor (ECF subfamily)